MQARLNARMAARPVTTLAQRLRLARKARKLTQDQLAQAAGENQPNISKLELGTISQTTAIARIADALRVPVRWLELGEGAEPAWTNAHPHNGGADTRGALAHQMNHSPAMIDPITIAWGLILDKPLPALFKVVIEDDAMAPEFPRGCTVTFSTSEGPPRPRDAVLVADADGGIYFREYQVGRVGRWRAVALSHGYQPLDSEDDGLRVLAVSMGRWGRRG